MKIPYTNLHQQYVDCKWEIDRAIEETIATSQFITGSYVDSFETALAEYTGAGFDKASPLELLVGVGSYTASEGHLATRYWDEPGAQGDLISATINGILDYTPSIMPFYSGTHAVLIKGYKYHKDEYGRPIAEKVHFHDPDNEPNKTLLAGTLGVCDRTLPAFVIEPWEPGI